MTENLTQKASFTWRFLLLLVIAALLIPHTLEIESQNLPDAVFTRYSVIIVLLTVSYEFGSTLMGPYSTIFVMPPTSAIVLNVLALLINISIIISLLGLVRGMISKKRVLYIIGIALCVQVFLLLGIFSYRLDSWASGLAIPLPVFPIVSALAVINNRIAS
jgi:hypothetical protein